MPFAEQIGVIIGAVLFYVVMTMIALFRNPSARNMQKFEARLNDLITEKVKAGVQEPFNEVKVAIQQREIAMQMNDKLLGLITTSSQMTDRYAEQSAYYERRLNEIGERHVATSKMVGDLVTDLEKATLRNSELHEELSTLKDKQTKHLQASVKRDDEIAQLQRELKEVQKLLKETQDKLIETTKQLEQTRAELEQAKQQIVRLETERTSSQLDLESERAKVKVLESRVAEQQTEINSLNAEVKRLRSELEAKPVPPVEVK